MSCLLCPYFGGYGHCGTCELPDRLPPHDPRLSKAEREELLESLAKLRARHPIGACHHVHIKANDMTLAGDAPLYHCQDGLPHFWVEDPYIPTGQPWPNTVDTGFRCQKCHGVTYENPPVTPAPMKMHITDPRPTEPCQHPSWKECYPYLVCDSCGTYRPVVEPDSKPNNIDPGTYEWATSYRKK